MKVAIMGAGVSGLATAITLEQHGINSSIFERKSEIGDPFECGHIFFSNLTGLTEDVVRYLTEEYGISIRPNGNIRKMTVFSENEQVSIEGQIGFFLTSGKQPDTLNRQLKAQVKSPITYDSKVSYEELLLNYSHVIVSTGEPNEYTAAFSTFNKLSEGTFRWVTISGQFDRYTFLTWLNNKLAPYGYCYLIPYHDTEACLGLVIPDNSNIKDGVINQLWDTFMERAKKDLGQSFKVIGKLNELNHRTTGKCQYPRIGNTFFVGNCFSTMLPVLGAGFFTSMLPGIYAAKDILGMGSYDELTKPISKSYHRGLTIRRVWQQMDNSDYDFLVRLVQKQFSKKIISANFDTLKVISQIMKPWAALR